MRVLVVGFSKGFNPSDVALAIQLTGWNITSIEILSQGYRGVDNYVSKFAEVNNIPLNKLDEVSDSSGMFKILVRGAIIGCDCVLAFWDGDSKKTVDVVEMARVSGKLIYIYEKEEEYENYL